MGEESQSLLKHLIELSRIDSALAGIFAEKKKLQKELTEVSSSLKRAVQELGQKTQQHQERELRYKKEERRLREEQEKLVARRKSLTSLNNYKVQQAAEKEIEHASHQLSQQEEALIASLDEIEKVGDAVKTFEEKAALLKEEQAKLQSEVETAYTAFEDRESRYQAERLSIVQHVEPRTLQQYERIRERFVMDPVVEIQNSCCTGCHMQIGPQIIVQVARGDALVRCPGCGRIVYLTNVPGANAPDDG